MYAANIYICTPTQTHTHTHTGAQFIYVAVYYHYHQTRGSKQEPGCISLLDAHHHCLSLRCLSSCHFGGSPAGIPTLLCPLCLLQTFIVFLSLFVFVSQVRTALIYFSSFLFSSLLVLFSRSLHSTHKFFFLHSFFFHSIRSL